jgi:hypothetical protein
MYSYDRQASSNTSLADQLVSFFEETGKALQKAWGASAPALRVKRERGQGLTHTVEIVVGPDTSSFNRKVSFALTHGGIECLIEKFEDRKMTKIGSGNASLESTPDQLARVVDGLVAGGSFTY